MRIDCTRCPARGHRCDSCVIGLVVGEGAPVGPPAHPELGDLTLEERRALSVLVAAGLVDPPAVAAGPRSTRLAG